MHGHSVTCPLHNWKIDLTSGNALAPDEGCSNVFPVKVEGGKVFLQLATAETPA
jgi:nitrite reductase (NADH) small subunit